ncbi:cytochrome P450 [Ornithinimicrobium sp. Y1847]|uniref:cytochrome P450 n=1 Tax=Ornithinimicrobium sp. Y1847 TaxID=3405419 RepID=UPI003B67AAA4
MSPKSHLPPGPKSPALLQTLRSYTGEQRGFPALVQRYGPTFTIRLLPGPQTYVLFSEPDDIKAIFAGDAAEFSGAGGNEVLRAAMGDRSVMLNDGAEHRRMRGYLRPAFSPGAVAAYRPVVEELTHAEVERWVPGQTVSSLERMAAITLEVMLRVVFGVSEGERLEQLRPRVLRLAEVGPVVVVGWLYPTLRALPPWRGHAANLREVDALIHAEIDARRAGDRDKDDLLTRLLAVGSDGLGDEQGPLPAQELRDQLVTLLLAGYETSASALSWTLHELARDPRALAAAQHAADEGDEAYLEACVKEAMRLHPIIDFVARTLRSPQQIGGWDLPAGVTVAPAIMLAHHREAAFAEPEQYRPERFLGDGPAAHTWIPFGGGVRRCVGASFALMEGVVVLREVLRRFDLVADESSPTRLRNITNVPGDGAPLRLLARASVRGTG